MPTTTETTRLRHGYIQTPLVELQHQEHDSTISLVGVSHFGYRRYYQRIEEYIAERHAAGAAVHYEMIRMHSPNEVDWEDDRHKRSYTEMLRDDSAGDIFISFIMKQLHVVRQQSVLSYPRTWERHDMDGVQIAQALAKKRYIENRAGQLLVRGIAGCLKALPPKQQESLARRVMKLLLVGPDDEFAAEFPREKAVILDQRNGVALDAVKAAREEQPEQDFVLLWGAGHTPGLMKGLESEGYKPAKTYWLNAIRVAPPIKLTDSFL